VKVTETSADLALLLAMVSSLRDVRCRSLVVFGEVGLAGEIRPVPSGQERISERRNMVFVGPSSRQPTCRKKCRKGCKSLA
jgi:predicted ATP-dependent serine protease